MSRGLLGFALLVVLIAWPATGEAGEGGVALSGRGELRATYLHLDDAGKDVIQGGEATNYWTLEGGGALDLASRAWHLQADFAAEGKLDERSADDTYRHSYGGGLHLGARDPELGSLGVFGGVGEVEIKDVGMRNPDTVVWGVGLEGQLFFDPVTLYLQAGYLDREPVSSGGDVDALKNAGFGRTVVRYFCGEDFEIEAELSYAQGKMDDDEDDVGIFGWGLGAEYRLTGTPVAGFVAYTGARYDQSDDHDVLYEHRIGFGVRAYFGSASLKANDRRGASLDLPRWLEWNGQIAGALE